VQRGLTIGIDARATVEEGAGQGRVERELLRALAARDDPHHYRCYARSAWKEFDERFQWRTLELPDPVWHWRVARSAGAECDVLLSPGSYVTVCFASGPAVAIVHDLASFDGQLQPNRRSMIVERATLGLAVRRAAAVIAVSRATADALCARFPKIAGKVTVALEGVTPELAQAASAAELATLPRAGFVLAVGTLEPRKNLPRLAAAYAALPADLRAAHPLVIAGRIGWRSKDTLTALEALGDEAVKLGFVSDGALAELYRRCALLCYPSLGEGFGLPVLEAMAAGAAVVTSNVSSLPEVGGDAVAYVDPSSVASITGVLCELLENPARRRELGELGRERARQFSWDRFAATVLGVLEGAAAAGR
jgi:glycosyltransferase involved in cell wall biosynthesis